MENFKAGSGVNPPVEGEARNELLLQLARDWIKMDPQIPHQTLMQELIDTQNYAELEKRLIPRIQFGTAGLRGEMTAGYSKMNHVTVQQAAQGLAMYLLEFFPQDQLNRGVVIGYDARHNSASYSEISAAVFHMKGIRVMLYPHYDCTPMVPFGTIHQKALAGIMVTASHNPKKDNGYKLYWENGAQIISPHDANITKHILQNLDLWDLSEYFPNQQFDTNKVGTWDFQTVLNDYVSTAKEKYSKRAEHNPNAGPMVYTAMHGVGYQRVKKIVEAFGFPALIPVEEQVEPDPEFSTVVYPNPEEGEGSLKLGIAKAEAANCPIIVANDPDADRLAVAEKVGSEWKVYSGDEIAMVLAYWMTINYSGSKQAVMVNSTVSSKFIKSICDKHNMIYDETLTGFKWISNKVREYESQGKEVLFSYEEAIGFSIGTHVYDKDGVVAIPVFYEAYEALCRAENRTMLDLIEWLRNTYGFTLGYIKYFLCYDPPTIVSCFTEIRNNGDYQTKVGKFDVERVRDLTVGYDSSKPPDFKPDLPVSGSTQMITYWVNDVESGSKGVFTLRTSGTEPKVKYYVEVIHQNKQTATDNLQLLVQSIIDQLLQPEKWGMQKPLV